MLARAFGKSLVGSLQNTLRPDVNSGTRRHLAIHGQPEGVQAAELIPMGPFRNQVGIGDEDPRRFLMSFKNPRRFARLDEQSLIVVQSPEGADDGLVANPVAGRLAPAPVND